MRPSLSLIAVLLLLPAAARADHFSRHYQVSGRPELRLVTDDGRVRVQPGSAGEIEIEVETEGWRIAPGQVRIEESQSGDEVRFEVHRPRRWGVVLGCPFEPRRRISISVLVPPELDLDVVSGDGGVELADLRGHLDVRTGDGHVAATNLRGETSLRTGDGGIEAVGIEGRFSGQTGDGRVRVEGRFESLFVHSGDGPVTVVVDRGSEVSGEWRLTSGDGPLVLQLPRDLRADLEASTGDGHISTDLPITVSGTLNRAIHGHLNGGGPPITVHTGDGSIRIEER